MVIVSEPNCEYVISLRAYNDVGDGRPIYETIRTREEEETPEASTPLVPPVGLNAIVLSSSTVVLTWIDSSLFSVFMVEFCRPGSLLLDICRHVDLKKDKIG